MTNFLIIDDHAVVRSGVKLILETFFFPCLVYEATTEDSAKKILEENAVDVVITDVQMPASDVLSIIKWMKENYPGVRILVFSMTPEKIYARKLLIAGAMGFISKESGMEELKAAIISVLDNRTYISSKLAEHLAEDAQTLHIVNPFEKLSRRELEIASLLAQGKKIKDIANALDISRSAAGTFKTRLMEKLHTSNIIELIELRKLHGF